MPRHLRLDPEFGKLQDCESSTDAGGGLGASAAGGGRVSLQAADARAGEHTD